MDDQVLTGWLVFACFHGEVMVPEAVGEGWLQRGWIDAEGSITDRGKAHADLSAPEWGVEIDWENPDER